MLKRKSLSTRYDREHIIRLLDFAGLTAWVMICLYVTVSALLGPGVDFRGYYAAARVVLEGGNPYDYQTLAPVLLSVTGKMGNNPFYYPPWFAWLMIPFAWLPYQVARGVWLFANIGLWAIGLLNLSKLLDWPTPGWKRWTAFILVTLLFAWMTLHYEQMGIVLFALVVGLLVSLRWESVPGTGSFLALLMIKPNVTLFLVFAVSLWLLRRRNWKPVAIMVILNAAALVLFMLLTPDWYGPFMEPNFGQGLVDELDGPGTVVAQRLNTTLVDWLKMLNFPSNAVYPVYLLALAAGLGCLGAVVWRSRSVYQVVAVALLVSYAITPYALQYDYPPLVVALIWIMALSSQLVLPDRLIGGAVLLFIGSVLFWERPISDGYWIVIGLIALALWVWFRTDRRLIPAQWL